MPPTARIPRELATRPFSLKEARAAGLSESSLKGKRWKRLAAGLYCLDAMVPDAWELLTAWRRILPPDAVFVGRTAAWLHGLDLEPANPIEVAVPRRSHLRSRAGVSVWRCDIGTAAITTIKGMRATSLARTLLDLCARRPPLEALIALDMARRRKVRLDFSDFKGRPGAARLQRLAGLAAPAESTMETRLAVVVAIRRPTKT